MPASELMEWSAFERVHGTILIHERVELMVAILCSLIANVYSDKRRYKPADFLPKWDGENRVQSVEDMISTLDVALSKRGT